MRIKTLFLAALVALAFTISASAQRVGLYIPLTGGTTRLPAATTNVVALGVTSTNTYGLPGTSTNLSQTVGEFDTAGLTFSSAVSTNVTLSVYVSYDNGTTYGTNPAYTYTGSGTYSTNASLSLPSATHIAFKLANVGTLEATNVYLAINLKAPKELMKPATQ